MFDGSPEAACSGYGSVPHPVEQAISWNIDGQGRSAGRDLAARILRPEDDGYSSLTHEKPHRERALDPPALARKGAAARAGVGLARARAGRRSHEVEVGGAVYQASGGGRNDRGVADDAVAHGPRGQLPATRADHGTESGLRPGGRGGVDAGADGRAHSGAGRRGHEGASEGTVACTTTRA